MPYNKYKIWIIISTILFLGCLTGKINGSEILKTVPVGVLESFNITDSTASQRYENAYKASLYYAVGKNETLLNKCGYKLQIIPTYFRNSNLLTAAEKASELESQGVWLIIGPTRSDQFLTAAKSLKNTPMITLMGESNSISKLNPPFFTAASGINSLVEAASEVVRLEKIGKNYGAFIDATCKECKEFENEFDRSNLKELNKIFSIDGFSEKPSIDTLFQKLESSKIDFLLLPNYSKFTGYVITQVHAKFPTIKFLGADGWGQSTWSYFPGYGISNDTLAYSVRSGFSEQEIEQLYDVHSLDIAWKSKIYKPPFLAYSTVKFIDHLVSDLCESTPHNKQDFFEKLSAFNVDHYKDQASISLYKLKNGAMEYEYKLTNSNFTYLKRENETMISTRDFLGEWELLNFIIEKPDKSKKSWGKNPHGLLIYSPNGYMSVSINSQNESGANISDKDNTQFLFYSGTFQVKDGKITHHVLNATDKNRIGKDLVREVSFDNDLLILQGKGDFGNAILTWKKIPKRAELKVSLLNSDSPLMKARKENKIQSSSVINPSLTPK